MNMDDDFRIEIVDKNDDSDGWAHVAGRVSCELCRFCAQATEFDRKDTMWKASFPFIHRRSTHTLQSLQFARCTSSKSQYTYCHVERSSQTPNSCGRAARHFLPKS